MYILVCNIPSHFHDKGWYITDYRIKDLFDFLEYDERFKTSCGPHVILWAGGVW